MKHPTVNFGGSVKALGDGRVGGHLVLFGDAKSADLAGEWFTGETDYDIDLPGKSAIYYHHGLDATLKKAKLGVGDLKAAEDEVGIWIEGQLDLRTKYGKAVYKLVEEDALGWSSGTASHLVEKKTSGEIVRWPLGLDASLTPTPCDPRNLATVKAGFLKSLPTFDDLMGHEPTIKSEGLSSEDKRRILQRALQLRLQATNPGGGYVYGWIVYDGVFDASFVYEAGELLYEAPYILNGLVAIVGDGVRVERQTKFVAVDATKSFRGVASEAEAQRIRSELLRERIKSERPRSNLALLTR